MMIEDKRRQAAGKERPPKEAYSSPQLEVHGSVKEITRNIDNSGSDGPLGSSLAGTP
jgi:hypothetical protein